MSFIWPLMLITLIFIPLLIGIYFRLLRRRQQITANLGALGIVQNSSGRELGKRRHAPPTLYLLGLTFLMIGLARPEMIVNIPRTEGTVILAFDVSNSMAADDLEPTRIGAAKEAARVFVENQPRSISVGVVAFSNGGLVVQQPTNDQAAILTAIERLSPQGGTSLGQGIFTSLNAIAGEAIAIDETALEEGAPAIDIGYYPSAVVLLLSDGENTRPPEPLEITQLAAEAGVRIYPVGIGSPEGAVLQIDGFNILTQLNETTLEEIASLSNGQYYYAEDKDSLVEIYKNIDLQLTIKEEMTEVTSVMAGISMLLLLIGGVLSLIWFGRVP
jgi:Ca-activated chloride channel family protein